MTTTAWAATARHKAAALAAALASALACAPALADIPAAERQALLDLYDNTDGANWSKKANWNGAPVSTPKTKSAISPGRSTEWRTACKNHTITLNCGLPRERNS